MEEGKHEGGAPSQPVKDVAKAGKEVVDKVRQAGQTAAARAAKAGQTAAAHAARVRQTAREIGAGVQKRVERAQKDLAPAAAKAKQGLQQAQVGLGKAFQATARATRKSARIIGLKAQIAAATHKLEKLHGQIGEAYVKAQHRKGAVPAADKTLAALVKSADAANRQIQQLRAKAKAERESS